MYKEFSGRFEESMHFGEEDRVVFHVFEPADLDLDEGSEVEDQNKSNDEISIGMNMHMYMNIQ